MENLKAEFNQLMKLAGAKAQNEGIEKFYQKYKDNAKAKAEILKLIKEGVADSGKRIEDLSVSVQLYEASRMLNLSYIAGHYFHKTKSWLSQRINSNIVNGKPAKFTDEEIKMLNLALKDMGKKIGSFTVQN